MAPIEDVVQPSTVVITGEGSQGLAQPHVVEEEMERPGPTKPVILRVKRKRTLAPIETLWLEVNERASKRRGGFQDLAITDDQQGSSVAKNSKSLFSRVQTVSSDEAILESLEELQRKKKAHKEHREGNIRPPTLGSSAKAQHDAVARKARFHQVWSSRRGGSVAKVEDTPTMELFHLYELVRVDVEEEAAAKAARRQKAKQEATVAEEGQWLCNYLPLLREYLPAVAAEVETAKPPEEPSTQKIESDDVGVSEEFVYDVYTLEEDADQDDTSAPTVVVADEAFDWRELDRDSNYDSEDSNAADNPNNDYPDEEDSNYHFGSDSSSEQDDPLDYSNEEYDTVAYDVDEDDMYWRPRR